MKPVLTKNPTGQFGKRLLNDFYLDPSYINVNHGSYGSCPKKVMAIKRQFQQRMDYNTQMWFRFDAQGQILKVRQFVGKYVNAPADNIFMVENASDGFNGFAKSIKWNEGDVIALPNTSYAMVKKTADYLVDKYKVKLLAVQVGFIQIQFTEEDYKTQESLLLKIQNTINDYPGKIRLAINDHIGSVPAVIFPIEAIIAFYHEKGIPIFVDGAHAVCQTDIDIKKLNPDGYVSNFHKWAYAPKQAAFVYISDKFKTQVHPAITGNFYGSGLDRQYFWTGTRDFSSYCAVPEGINYYQSFGAGAVRQYCHSLTMQAANLMASIWKTKLLTNDERLIGYLNNIEVPSKDIGRCVEICNTMLKLYNCYPVVFEFGGKVYCRISAQIYNDISDFQFAAEKFLDLLIGKK